MTSKFSPAVLLIVAGAVATIATPALADKRNKGKQVFVAAPGRTPMASEEPVPPPPPPAPTTTVAQGISASATHLTLTRLLNSAQLNGPLSGPGPFTVFAPSDDAFSRLAPGTVDTLLKPENIASLTAILKYHVVMGALTLEDIQAKIAAGGGSAMLTTLQGGTLTATMAGEILLLTDQNGNKSYISQPDVKESNGIIQIVNGVVVPKFG